MQQRGLIVTSKTKDSSVFVSRRTFLITSDFGIIFQNKHEMKTFNM